MSPYLRLSFFFFVVVMAGCASPQAARYVAAPATYVDTAVQGPVAGVGVESQDIDGMVDTMARDLLATPQVVSRSVAPRIVLDDSEFMNKGFQAMDKSMITDSLRVKLNRASQGRMVFLDYAHIGMVQNARQQTFRCDRCGNHWPYPGGGGCRLQTDRRHPSAKWQESQHRRGATFDPGDFRDD